jgi:predicted O-methyltransferase YrrM
MEAHMSNLRRFGHRQSARLQSLSRRQAVGLAVVGALCLGVAAASFTGRPGIAITLLACLVAAVLIGVMHVSRRLAALHRADQAANRDLRVVVEQLQRRLVAAVEKERLTAGDRHLEVSDAIHRAQRAAERGATSTQRATTREVEAVVQLFQDFTPRAPMPSSGDYALNPTDLLGLLHLIRTRRPRLVLELGSGTSSVWIAYALESTGGRLVSLDHDPEYAGRTRALLAAHGLTATAEVREAPLTALSIDDKSFQWYDVAAVADLDGIDLLLVDGPPAATGRDARYPALRVIEPKLAATATVVCDDANRRDEQAAVLRWTQSIPGLTREPELLGRHAVLSYTRTAPAPAMAPVPS